MLGVSWRMPMATMPPSCRLDRQEPSIDLFTAKGGLGRESPETRLCARGAAETGLSSEACVGIPAKSRRPLRSRPRQPGTRCIDILLTEPSAVLGLWARRPPVQLVWAMKRTAAARWRRIHKSNSDGLWKCRAAASRATPDASAASVVTSPQRRRYRDAGTFPRIAQLQAPWERRFSVNSQP
jgi:hypothetical protein